MVKRGEVEALLRAATMGESVFPIAVSYVALAELCRTWLAVDGAPIGEVLADDSNSLDRPVTWTPMIIDVTDILTEGQRVKLVLVPEAGGGEG